MTVFSLLLALIVPLKVLCGGDIDLNGYILYCPCMGRFGNQAEQLLGSLQFAKALNRTLVLPPFIDYRNSGVNFIPFQSVLSVNRLKEFHKVITIQDFMEEIAFLMWEEADRPVFCYSQRPGKIEEDCNPCEGNPFESFWKQFNISHFSSSIFYGPLTTDYKQASKWKRQYSSFKVLTFVGAPSSFPVNREAIEIQEYVSFSQEFDSKSNDFIQERNLIKPYIGVHLRWGSDWQRACTLLKENLMRTMFSSSQCSDGDKILPAQLCIQDIIFVTEVIRELLTETNFSDVYIASDLNDKAAWQSIYQSLSAVVKDLRLFTPSQVYGDAITFKNQPVHFLTDLYLLSKSDIFIGNCISSFSAFVSRIRTLSSHKPKNSTRFFGSEFLETAHDEL